MDPRHKANLLWGVVGGLAFLVLVQGYELVTSQPIALAVKAGIAVVVMVAVTLLAYVARPRLYGNESP